MSDWKPLSPSFFKGQSSGGWKPLGVKYSFKEPVKPKAPSTLADVPMNLLRDIPEMAKGILSDVQEGYKLTPFYQLPKALELIKLAQTDPENAALIEGQKFVGEIPGALKGGAMTALLAVGGAGGGLAKAIGRGMLAYGGAQTGKTLYEGGLPALYEHPLAPAMLAAGAASEGLGIRRAGLAEGAAKEAVTLEAAKAAEADLAQRLTMANQEAATVADWGQQEAQKQQAVQGLADVLAKAGRQKAAIGEAQGFAAQPQEPGLFPPQASNEPIPVQQPNMALAQGPYGGGQRPIMMSPEQAGLQPPVPFMDQLLGAVKKQAGIEPPAGAPAPTPTLPEAPNIAAAPAPPEAPIPTEVLSAAAADANKYGFTTPDGQTKILSADELMREAANVGINKSTIRAFGNGEPGGVLRKTVAQMVGDKLGLKFEGSMAEIGGAATRPSVLGQVEKIPYVGPQIASGAERIANTWQKHANPMSVASPEAQATFKQYNKTQQLGLYDHELLMRNLREKFANLDNTAMERITAAVEKDKVSSLSPEEQALANVGRELLDNTWLTDAEYGIETQYRPDYVHQVWAKSPGGRNLLPGGTGGSGTSIGGSINPGYTMAKKWGREEGKAAGGVSLTDNFLNLLDIRLKKSVYDRAKKQVVDDIMSKTTSDGMPAATYENLTELGYEKVTDPSFRKYMWRGMGKGKSGAIASDTIYVHPEWAPIVKAQFEQSLFDQHGVLRGIKNANAAAKESILNLSLFHFQGLGRVNIFNTVNPLPWGGKNYKAGLDLFFKNDPELRRGIATGLEMKPGGVDIQRGLVDNLVAGLESEGLPGRAIKQFNERIRKPYNVKLWDEYWRGSKAMAYKLAFKKNRAAYPNWTAEEAATRAAYDMNALYGGLNYTLIGRSKTIRDFSRLLFLAPDWNEGNLRLFGSFFRKEGGKVPRDFGIKMFYGLVGLEILNRATSGHSLYNNDPGHQFQLELPWKNEKGRKQYFKAFGHLEDAYRFTNDFIETSRQKGSPLVKIGAEIATNRDWRGEPIYNRYGSQFAQFGDIGLHAGGSVTPIPIKGALDFAQGKTSLPGFLGALGGAGLTSGANRDQLSNWAATAIVNNDPQQLRRTFKQAAENGINLNQDAINQALASQFGSYQRALERIRANRQPKQIIRYQR